MATPINLSSYDAILINTSAGKDSQTMMHLVHGMAVELGIQDRLVAVHCDLGRVEWKGTRELAIEQCAHYGIKLHIVSRPQGDLLEQVEKRGMWPSNKQRYCTSDQKRGQVDKVITKLEREWREQTGAPKTRVFRVLNCMGLRAEESTARAKKVEFENAARTSTRSRTVDTWLPIHDWTETQVWESIRLSGVRAHYAYELGMPRLSCCFCIFAPVKALVIAGQHNPELLQQYVDVERKINHTFRKDTTLVSIQEMVQSGAAAAGPMVWEKCY